MRCYQTVLRIVGRRKGQTSNETRTLGPNYQKGKWHSLDNHAETMADAGGKKRITSRNIQGYPLKKTMVDDRTAWHKRSCAA